MRLILEKVSASHVDFGNKYKGETWSIRNILHNCEQLTDILGNNNGGWKMQTVRCGFEAQGPP